MNEPDPILPAHVVVVNDDATQLLLWTNLLKKAAQSVHAFESAETALRAMRTDIHPDLIVTDLHMPGIDGWRFCRLLRSPEYPAFNRTPILVMSATFAGEDARQITADLGANAFLSVPFVPAEMISMARQLLAGQTPAATSRVLIVEDDEVVSHALLRLFNTHGHQTTAVRTASEGLRICRQQAQELIVVDYHLPDMPGDLLLEEVVRINPACAVIMITGDPRPELALEWIKRGARGYVHKPFDPEYLVALCDRARREIAMLQIESRLEERTRALREQEERYRTLFEGVTDALFVHHLLPNGAMGHFIEVNDVACRLLGYTREELLGLSIQDIYAPAGTLAMPHLLAELKREQAVTLEQMLVAKDGHCIPTEIHARAFTMYGQCAVISLARDITERKQSEAEQQRLEHQIQQMQKQESLGIVAGGIAHDFNNILLTILGNVELALRDIVADSPAHISLMEVEKAARHAADLSQNMLIYSGHGTFLPQAVRLSDLVADMRPTLTALVARNINLRFELTPQQSLIAADPAHLHQLLTNLVINAGEAIGGRDGEIIVRTGEMNCDQAYLATTWLQDNRPPGRYVFVEVADNGCGMDSATRERIFDPFYTTKFTGRGLGLAAVLGTVRSHQGTLTVSSRPEQGTTIRVLLPASEQVMPPLETRTSTAGDSYPHGIVLVVDDEEPVRDLGCRMVERLGLRALPAADGQEAITLMKAHGADIVCMMLDLTMPRMDGSETFHALQEIKPGLPIIMSSGFDERSATRAITGQGFAGFLPKPYHLATLRKILNAALGDKATPAPVTGRG